MVKAKKHLGQHFLKDLSIAQRIAESFQNPEDLDKIIEVGPGTGALTQFLLPQNHFEVFVSEIDRESIAYLKEHYAKELEDKIIEESFLDIDLTTWADGKKMGVAGNFPYNISSQIVFHILDHMDSIPEMVGMFQKEVAERICTPPGKKAYGILSVFAQAFYDCEYLFTVNEDVFDPPPKVKSGVMRMKRNNRAKLEVELKYFKQIVKLAFNQRRKTLRNSLKSVLPEEIREWDLLQKRPEQLGVDEFVEICKRIQA